jgi:hypothetical protein
MHCQYAWKHTKSLYVLFPKPQGNQFDTASLATFFWAYLWQFSFIHTKWPLLKKLIADNKTVSHSVGVFPSYSCARYHWSQHPVLCQERRNTQNYCYWQFKILMESMSYHSVPHRLQLGALCHCSIFRLLFLWEWRQQNSGVHNRKMTGFASTTRTNGQHRHLFHYGMKYRSSVWNLSTVDYLLLWRCVMTSILTIFIDNILFMEVPRNLYDIWTIPHKTWKGTMMKN